MIRAWHFVGKTLRDGSKIPRDGVWLKHPGEIVICLQGLHACRDAFDALLYAPGATLCLVDCDGKIIEQSDKLVCSARRIVQRMDATDMLRYFARMQAVSCIDKWDAPDVACDYLMTGDESIRDAARDAAWAAAWAAARDATWASAWDATWNATRKDFNELVAECFGVSA